MFSFLFSCRISIELSHKYLTGILFSSLEMIVLIYNVIQIKRIIIHIAFINLSCLTFNVVKAIAKPLVVIKN